MVPVLPVGTVSAGDPSWTQREEGGAEWRMLSREARLWEWERERIRGSEGVEDWRNQTKGWVTRVLSWEELECMCVGICKGQEPADEIRHGKSKKKDKSRIRRVLWVQMQVWVGRGKSGPKSEQALSLSFSLLWGRLRHERNRWSSGKVIGYSNCNMIEDKCSV